MRQTILALAVVAQLLGVPNLEAAEIAVLNGELILSGEIVRGDSEKFLSAANKLPNGSVVRLQSPGGLLVEGIAIGKLIRKRQFSTLVAPNGDCASACALIWLGGNNRWIASNARVGFHQSYIERGRQKIPSITGNARIGAYLARLGFPDKTVYFVTRTPPKEIEWLNPREAGRFQIAYRTGAPPDSQRFISTRPGKVLDIQGIFAKAVELDRSKRYSEAAKWYRKAAELGHGEAQTLLAIKYETGEGVSQNAKEAVRLYKLAVRQGNTNAAALLAFFYEEGEVLEKNYREAARLWRMAATKDDSLSAYMLGELYEAGQGVEQDYYQAAQWYRKALKLGTVEAKSALKRIGFSVDVVSHAAKSGVVRYPRGRVPLKAETSTHAAQLDILNNRTPVTILHEFNGWYEVRLRSGKIGYVHTSWIKVDQFFDGGFDSRHIQIKSFQSLYEARQFALSSSFPLSVFLAGNGWYAVTLRGLYENKQAERIVEQMKLRGQIPHDSFSTYGNTYVRKVCCD